MRSREFDGTWCRELRESAGLSARELAAAATQPPDASITESAVCRWERGDRSPSPKRLIALALALGVKPEELLVKRAAGAA